MPQITDYTSLAAAIDEWDERSHDADELVGLSEAEFRIYLGPNYARETGAAVSFTNGLGSLPTGFVRFISLSDTTYGNLTQVSWDALTDYNVTGGAGIPTKCAISGTQIKTDYSFTGSRTLRYEGTLTGLTTDNPTNWLIEIAPQAYLSMCMSFAKAKFEDYSNAAMLKGAAFKTLADLGMQSTVAQYGRASLRLRAAP